MFYGKNNLMALEMLGDVESVGEQLGLSYTGTCKYQDNTGKTVDGVYKQPGNIYGRGGACVYGPALETSGWNACNAASPPLGMNNGQCLYQFPNAPVVVAPVAPVLPQASNANPCALMTYGGMIMVDGTMINCPSKVPVTPITPALPPSPVQVITGGSAMPGSVEDYEQQHPGVTVPGQPIQQPDMSPAAEVVPLPEVIPGTPQPSASEKAEIVQLTGAGDAVLNMALPRLTPVMNALEPIAAQAAAFNASGSSVTGINANTVFANPGSGQTAMTSQQTTDFNAVNSAISDLISTGSGQASDGHTPTQAEKTVHDDMVALYLKATDSAKTAGERYAANIDMYNYIQGIRQQIGVAAQQADQAASDLAANNPNLAAAVSAIKQKTDAAFSYFGLKGLSALPAQAVVMMQAFNTIKSRTNGMIVGLKALATLRKHLPSAKTCRPGYTLVGKACHKIKAPKTAKHGFGDFTSGQKIVLIGVAGLALYWLTKKR